ncbi:unnamed protein product [Closterium sp. NIES-53]
MWHVGAPTAWRGRKSSFRTSPSSSSRRRSTTRSWRTRAVSRERACQLWTTPPATPPTCLAASPSPTTGLARPPLPRSLSRLFLVLRLWRVKANAVVTDLWYYCDCTLA